MSTTEPVDLGLTRRVVTGHDANAKSRVLYDDTSRIEASYTGPDYECQAVWVTDSVPADCSSEAEADLTKEILPIVNAGSICRIVWSRPGMSTHMHRTQSIDYGVVLEGEIELELDNGERRLMKAGDVVVQRGTMHAWHNRHATQWAKMLFVVICAKEPQGA